MTDEEWKSFEAQNPQAVAAARQNLVHLARGRLTWAQLLGVPDAELLGLARLAAAKMDRGRPAEAERMFRALTEIDPFVPWFWLALGDARSRQGKSKEASEAYGRCIAEAGQLDPPGEEMRSASYRRATLRVQAGDMQGALEDFRTVLAMDTSAVHDGERAWLALEALADQGRIPREVLATLPRPR
jgi:predicted Zn-dependent protease